ncbi:MULTISPECIES: hypothetical protein [Burkholderia]|uniref:hypothetical protein n=1 Tax=Burkholderia TaxID=32008 RepID=UPI001589E08D|nr:hypothetical protein [Burkholderia cepacia]MCA8053819.1 hypothetical protein [Burkholderia cepacia]MCA8131876.1 hypothetical protein [Burkholderia cepacia]MCA8159636.1 hypothetical protein [Burkholderia cepacia]HEM7889288.1 hypothetical protein [Burkholderia cepacia]HEM8509042.1 hypothetical protein [Burkholderia cepacia]
MDKASFSPKVMPSRKPSWIAVSFAFFFLAPSASGYSEEVSMLQSTEKFGGTEIHVEIEGGKAYREAEMDKALVYGKIKISDSSAGAINIKANLTCVSISINQVRSERIYIDSVAHILPENYLMNNGEAKVYWKMERFVDVSKSNGSLSISLKKGCSLFPSR